MKNTNHSKHQGSEPLSWRWLLFGVAVLTSSLWLYQFNWLPTTWTPQTQQRESILNSADSQFVITSRGPLTQRMVQDASGAQLGELSDTSLVVIRQIGVWDKEVHLPVFGATETAISGNGQTIATANTLNEIQVWQLSNSKLLHTFPNVADVSSLALTHDASVLAVGTAKGIVTIWDLTTGELKTSKQYTETVTSITADAQGKLLVIALASRRLMIEIIEIPSGKFLFSLSPDGFVPVTSMFSPDGRWLGIGFYDDQGGRVDVWRLQSPQPQLERRMFTDDAIHAIAFSPDSRLIAAGGIQTGAGGFFSIPAFESLLMMQRILIWRLDSFVIDTPIQTIIGGDDYTQSLAFSADGATLIALSNNVRLFRVAPLPLPWWWIVLGVAIVAFTGYGWWNMRRTWVKPK